MKNVLVEHALNSNFSRLNLSNRNQIDSLTLQHQIPMNGNLIPFPVQLTEEQKSALRNIYDLYKQDETVKQENIKVFMQEWDKRTNLKTLREWWDNIGTNIQLTSLGKVLAHSNAQRCDKTLPPLD